MTHRPCRLTCLLLLVAQALTGCATWQVAEVTPQALITRDHPSRIQVREKVGTKYVMAAPVVVGDTLVGAVKLGTGVGIGSEDRRTPLSVIDRIAVRKFSAGRTVVAVLGGAVVAFLGLALYVVQTVCISDNCGR